MMKIFRLIVSGAALAMAGTGWAQQRQVQPIPIGPQFPDAGSSLPRGADGTVPNRNDMGTGHPAPQLEAQQVRSRNLDRQKRMTADSERLLSLATQLKQTMGSGEKGAVSPDAARKAEEIEKLAKSVRDRMKG